MWAKKDNRRQVLIIDQNLQHRLIKDISRFPIIALMVGMLIMAVNFRLMVDVAFAEELQMSGIYGFIACMVGYVFLACYVTLSQATRLSHRIAGPLYRLHKAMEQLEKGDLNCKFTLRDGDYLTDTAELFNRMVTHLQHEDHPVKTKDRDPEQEEKREEMKDEQEPVGAIGSERKN
jgi:nitrogen fixation/metabolism regulation signal transduction histidine kinase